MPVQINELVIRANIVQEDHSEGAAKAPAAANDTVKLNKDEIIRECAAVVLEIINNKNQR